VARASVFVEAKQPDARSAKRASSLVSDGGMALGAQRASPFGQPKRLPEIAVPAIESTLCSALNLGLSKTKKALDKRTFFNPGGEGGIRTHGCLATSPDFESGTFDHSATSPRGAHSIPGIYRDAAEILIHLTLSQ
jgi:hypothetical protein